MAVISGDLVFYAAANRPLGDDQPAGGAIDLKTGILSTSLFDDQVLVYSSSASDVGKILTIRGHPRNDRPATVDIRLNGTTHVLSRFHFYRILDLQLDADAVGTITIKQFNEDTVFTTIAAGKRGHTTMFKYSYPFERNNRIRYDKLFVKNTSADSDMIDPVAQLSLDEGNNLTIGIDPTYGSSLSSATRLVTPVGVTFHDPEEYVDMTTDFVHGTQRGIWLKQVAFGGEYPEDSSFQVKILGSPS